MDRATSRVTIMASTEGGMEIEEVAQAPREDPEGRDRPGHRHLRLPCPQDRLRPGPRRQAGRRARSSSILAMYKAFIDLDCLDRRDQPAGRDRRGRHHRPRRQDELRRQRPVPPQGRGRAARRGRGGCRRAGSRQARPQLHQARRHDRLHGQRRRPGHGDHGHHQAATAASRPTSSMSAAAPRKERVTDGVQDHPVATRTSKASWSTSSAASCAAT